jgi:hypothetical protein
VEVIEDDLLKVHLDFLHLTEDDATLALDFLTQSNPFYSVANS